MTSERQIFLKADLSVTSLALSTTKYPRTGPLTVCLRGNKFVKATVCNHYADLLPLLHEVRDKDGKHAAVIVSDNGPDWRKHSLKVVMMMGRLWRDLGLDYLCIVAYALGDSKFNMIEHSWAPVTSWLTGLQLRATLPGEEKSPEEQSLNQSEKSRKTAIVLDTAIDDVQQCLQNRFYDSFPVNTKAVKSSAKHPYSDADKMEELSDASLLKIRNNNTLTILAEEYQFIARHSIQRTFQLEFLKCTDSKCGHCTDKPIRSQKLMAFL